jgi:hypothetical protein
MSKVLYEANPSLLRMNPLGTVLAILILLGGIRLVGRHQDGPVDDQGG